ncbi:hypothetical protein PT084_07845 [Erysipelothrix rhusiopathiae]|nr:hypothetical protein [Erysipelothrix rhusiopathiae]MDE8094553.1 hypothetical protein [Erysipelothrix rhusiopathiae]MDE8161577.1 hypothetical protein [Erysipelothrix rhusiopathiae]MDE8168400.1 hypothetical protein [Erysipelothrix rhusiopathiae]
MGEDTKKLISSVIFVVCFLIISFVLVLTVKKMVPTLTEHKYAEFMLEVPTVFALCQLAFNTLGKINPSIKTKVILTLKGFLVDTSVSVYASIKCDDINEYKEFEKKLSKRLSDDQAFDLGKNAKSEVSSTDFEVYFKKTNIKFKVSYGNSDIRIQFSEIQNRQYSIAKYIEKLNVIINQAQLCMPDSRVTINTSIVYFKSNPVMSELLKNDAKVGFTYSDKQYVLNSKRLEVRSSCSNQVDLVKHALTGKLIEN